MTIRTVLSSIVFVSILILLICPLLKNEYILKKTGPNIPIVVLFAVIARMFIPVEFGYTYDIYLDKYWTIVYDMVMLPLLFGKRHCEVWKVLLFIWLFGTVSLVLKKCFGYNRLIKCIYMASEVPVSVLDECMPEPEQYPELSEVKTVVLPGITGPFLFGFRHPVIVLPEREWKKEELAYVMQHELLHCRYHDICWKLAADILCTFMWWNPLFFYLKKTLFHLFEIRNDLRITKKMDKKQKSEYMDCLVKAVHNLGNRDQVFIINFSKNNVKELKQRLNMIVDGEKRNRTLGTIVFLFLGILVFVTTCVNLEPFYLPEEEPLDIMDETNTYLVYDGTGYDVYCDFEGTGDYEYAFRDTERNHFFKNTKVFQKGEKIDIK